ncbi:uncharacterized protein ACNLHF_001558 isoform 1-T2 [Anomaloglossus baeobatrachus]|uniref:uncharacterized protein LOC142256015 n=1 Tax=Anomaloglossus baeobatrachus TaxID=238106 RepID=UPI003F504C3B
MKVLLLSVALLFFTGAQGRHFWQSDEPQEAETAEKSLERMLHDSFGIVFSLLENLDYNAIAKEYQIKEKWDASRKHMRKLEKAIDSYYAEIAKKFDEQLHEKFPVFRKNVVPILKEFDDAIEEQFQKIVQKVVPVGSDLLAGISRNVLKFFENMESIAAEGRDKLRSEMDKLRVKVEPYVEGVHAEYEKYRTSLQGEFEKEMKELKEDVHKNMELLKERAKPHLEKLKNDFHAKEVQEKVEQFLKELKEALSKEE